MFRVGYALQLLYLKLKGISISGVADRIPENIIKFVSSQLDCSIDFHEEYWKIKNTKSSHFQEICQLLGYSKFEYNTEIKKEFHKISFSNGSNIAMVKEVFKFFE